VDIEFNTLLSSASGNSASPGPATSNQQIIDDSGASIYNKFGDYIISKWMEVYRKQESKQ
jgi:hypothetical protein